MRNYDNEFKDISGANYAYNFDLINRQYLLEKVVPHTIKNGRTLEVGAYEGDMTDLLLQHYEKIEVVEASENLCSHLDKRFGNRITIHQTRIEDFTSAEKFDTIFVIHTLEHFDDPVSNLRSLADKLSFGGLLIISVPNANALSRLIAVEMGVVEFPRAITRSEWEHGHRWTYDQELLRTHVSEAGLRIVEEGGVIVKPLSNSQLDQAMEVGIIDGDFLRACDALVARYPELASSCFALCSRNDDTP